MASANQISAEEIINTEPVKAQNDKSLASIKNKMEEEELRAIPVVDSKNNLEGVIGYRDLIRYVQFNPETTKLKKVMHQPPELDIEDNLVELCSLRINSGRKLLVNTEGKKLKGVIGDREFLEGFAEADELEKVSTRDIETRDLETVFEEDSLEEARHRMLDKNISRLPVLDKNGNMTGIIDSVDVLKTMIPREAPDTSQANPQGDEGGEPYRAGGEKEKLSEVPTEELMQRIFLTSEEHMSVKEAAQQMFDEERDEVIFVDGNYPQSIVTIKDISQHLADYAPGNTVFVNISGLDLPEERQVVMNKIKTQLQGSLGRKLDRAEELRLVVKKAEKDGKKHRWDIDLRLSSEYGLTKIDEEGWELMDVVDRALEELNTVVRKKKEKRNDHRA